MTDVLEVDEMRWEVRYCGPITESLTRNPALMAENRHDFLLREWWDYPFDLHDEAVTRRSQP